MTSEQDLTEATLAVTDGHGVDVVLDHVAGQTFADCLRATKEERAADRLRSGEALGKIVITLP
ncbi:hypothetical protein Rhow_004282 [Rhodococcus wratislaviensis]|uniref:Uncharacterized protein n=1 Tax=Rhodococcus wratislaviensis TaxID=44752 RepID=A0A402CAK8_RHOWR|nr:hypothetical protein [Rhodococcus wratislaviensis]GCE40639.1 hypothetical protein Rhow_004282 [Rhodococcus wratislaviensis]